MTIKDPHHLLDRLVCLMSIDYFSLYDGKREHMLTDQGWSDLIPLMPEYDRIREQIEEVNRRLGELGYKHKLTVHAVMEDDTQ